MVCPLESLRWFHGLSPSGYLAHLPSSCWPVFLVARSVLTLYLQIPRTRSKLPVVPQSIPHIFLNKQFLFIFCFPLISLGFVRSGSWSDRIFASSSHRRCSDADGDQVVRCCLYVDQSKSHHTIT